VKDRKDIWFAEEKFYFRNKDMKLRMKETSRTRKSREVHTVFVVVGLGWLLPSPSPANTSRTNSPSFLFSILV
jgi:hypothetical protein